jgi:RNA polymerase sigma factor (sigma-70 family)
MTIARRKAIDHHRARARSPEPRGELPEQPVAGPEAQAGDGDVWSAVAELSQAQRDAVALRYAADLSYREIGETLGISEAAARRRVSDALANLRTRIAEEEIR